MQDLYGIVAGIDELIAMRPVQGRSAMAPTRALRTRQAGPYRSAFRGRGMEFDESRAYQAGDDLRAIDWRVTARTGRVHTKLYHEERERPVMLLIDSRPMMRFGTKDCFKSVLAARAAAWLAWSARDGGDRIGGFIMTPTGLVQSTPHLSQARLLSFLKRIAQATEEDLSLTAVVDQEKPNTSPGLTDSITRLRRAIRPGTQVFILSDFHDFDETTRLELTRLSLNNDVACFFIYDALETRMPSKGTYRISDGHAVLTLNNQSKVWRQGYENHFLKRRRAVEDLCRQRGITFLPMETGQDPREVLRLDQLRTVCRRPTKGAA
ncbi:MAG: DUF58 domain-containing protein [Pseudomonadota bacterium]